MQLLQRGTGETSDLLTQSPKKYGNCVQTSRRLHVTMCRTSTMLGAAAGNVECSESLASQLDYGAYEAHQMVARGRENAVRICNVGGHNLRHPLRSISRISINTCLTFAAESGSRYSHCVMRDLSNCCHWVGMFVVPDKCTIPWAFGEKLTSASKLWYTQAVNTILS